MAANSTAVNGASDREEATTKAEEKSRSKLLRESCRRFWLSVNPLYQTLVLGMVLLVYLAASARVFMWLEADAEEERMVEVSRTRGELKLMLSMELPNATSERIDSILDTAACDAYLKLQANETVRLWDMGRAVVVAASIVATIGGDVLSTSKYLAEGITIVYALFGIPLIVAYLTVMGRLLSHIPRWILKPLQHRYWIHLMGLFSWLVVVFVGIITIPAAAIANIEGWEYREALYFCFVSMSTIGLGDYALGPDRDRLSNNSLRDLYKLCFVIWILCGLSHISTIIIQVREVWGGLWMRIKIFCRQVKQMIILRAVRSGKRGQLGKAADVGGVGISIADAEASAKQVERQKGKDEVQENHHGKSSSEIVSRREKASSKAASVASKELQPAQEHTQ